MLYSRSVFKLNVEPEHLPFFSKDRHPAKASSARRLSPVIYQAGDTAMRTLNVQVGEVA